MNVTRRHILKSAAGAAAVATGAAPIIQPADPEEEQVLALFQQMGDRERASSHYWMRYYAGLPDDPQLRRRFTGEAQL